MKRIVPAGQFRRRLTIVFVLVAGVSAGTVGLGAYVLVQDVRSDDFVERSLRDAAANFLSVEHVPVTTEHVRTVIDRLSRRGATGIVVATGEGVFSSTPRFDLEHVPEGLEAPREFDEEETPPHDDAAFDGDEYLVVATPFAASGGTMYFFYSKAAMTRSLRDLARITWRLWLVVVIGAALVGNALARRTLTPVSRASRAAQSLAEGLLATRLPVETEDEFGAWALSFNEMADALETKISELVRTRDRERRFTSDVAHELRTPVTALVGSASLLEDRLDELGPDARWMAEKMIAEARRLRALVDDLLEVSRLHSGHEVLRPSEFDLGRLVENVLEVHHWTGDVEFRPRRVVVDTDKGRVERIVVNLIANAVEHGGERPRVAVSTEEDAVVVEVRDDGPGIPEADLPHVFERFYKVDPARPGGSGLGLAIAAEHARLIGGSITVESAAGEGTAFTVRLPARGGRGEEPPVDAASLQA